MFIVKKHTGSIIIKMIMIMLAAVVLFPDNIFNNLYFFLDKFGSISSFNIS